MPQAKDGFVWEVTPDVAFGRLGENYARYLRDGVRTIANNRAPEIAEWMKSNHAWENRTGAAEAGLHTTVEEIALDMLHIVLAHGDDISYALALELANGGVWGVIMPALDQWGPVVWRDVQNLVHSKLASR